MKETRTDSVISSLTMSSAMASAERYHDWVFSSFAPQLSGGRVLEVGSGHGRYARKLARLSREVLVSDIDPVAVNRVRSELSDLHNVRYLTMDGVDPAALATPVDDIVLINVLEHIEDDGAALDNCRRALSERGRLAVFVPAFPMLYSRMDKQAGHFRRYRRHGLAELITRRGFRVRSIRYFNAVGFFGWLANKWISSDVESASTNLQIRAYDRLVPAMKYVDMSVPLIGQSLIAIADRT